MKGFLKRDLYLVSSGQRVLLVLVFIFLAVTAMRMGKGSNLLPMLCLYLHIYVTAYVISLFNYDDYNGWQGYAAAVPGGRRLMVDARYLLALALCLAAGVLSAGLSLAAGDRNAVVLALVYCGGALIYTAILLPMCYRFGGAKTRTYMLVIVAVTGGVIGALGTENFGSAGSVGGDIPIPVLLPVVGLLGLAVSLPISRHIMAKKEF